MMYRSAFSIVAPGNEDQGHSKTSAPTMYVRVQHTHIL